MQLPLSWLKSIFPHNVSSKIIDETLTKAGIEVDLVEPYNPPFSGVVCAKVEEVHPHPDANKLQVAKVFDGHTHYQVVCGAKNCRAGLYVAFAKPGAVLGLENPFEIKEKAVRGVHSQGMLCSLDELGLTKDEQPGIIELDETFKPGLDFHSLLKDEIFHISITPNLGHVLSVLGIARELSAFLKLPYNHSKPASSPSTSSKLLSIDVKSPSCLAYHALKIAQIQNNKTPFLIQHRLRLAGFNPKNLIVDVLNYVMFECGQPMHAFDAKKLKNDSLVIQDAKNQQPFHALNGKSYEISTHTLVIESDHHIAAVAGVMGSLDTSCQDDTTEVILESAHFSSQAIRSSIKSLDLRSDSANRFEKGIDPKGTLNALNLAASLIIDLSKGHPVGHFEYASTYVDRSISLRTDRTNRLLGTHLSQGEIVDLLKRLEMHISVKDHNVCHVTVPSYRNDLSIEEDLIEEVGRLYGLDHLQGHLSYQATSILDHPLYGFEKLVKKALFSEGLQEVLTCDLLSKELALDFKIDKGHHIEPICVLHPRSQDQCTLRMSLLSSLIPVIKKNISNKETNLALFEVGKIHAKKDAGFVESLQAAIILTGLSQPYYFDPKPKAYDFFDLKGIVENVLDDIGISAYNLSTSHDVVFHPYQQMTITKNDELVGKFGQIHPKLLKKYDIEQPVYYAEFSASVMMKLQKTIYPAKLPPTQPYVERDWTATISEDSSYHKLYETLHALKPDLSESICLLDIYPQGETKNITVRIRYRHSEKSLESTYVDQIHQNFISDVAKKLGLSL
jgi:phenylalanyl-tRNA synthetase beta chain